METGRNLERVVYGYWSKRFDCDPQAFFHSGTLVIPEERLTETGRTYLYHIDRMSVVRIAPSLAEKARLPVGYDKDSGSLAVNTLQALIHAELLNTLLDCYLDPKDFQSFAVDAGFTTRRLHPEKDNSYLLSLYEACNEADLDEAEISIREPDPVIYGMFDGGKLIAYASHRYWDDLIADIGVLIHPGYRGRGLGKAVVSALCEWCIRHDVVPMYRVYADHAHSRRIPEALGFKEMVVIETLSSIEDENTG